MKIFESKYLFNGYEWKFFILMCLIFVMRYWFVICLGEEVIFLVMEFEL